MSTLLRGIGVITIICGLIAGYINAKSNPVLEMLVRGYEVEFQWSIAFAWWISGAISGILFFAFAMMLDKMDQIQYQIDRWNAPESSAKKIDPSNSKMNLDSMKGYKMKSLD